MTQPKSYQDILAMREAALDDLMALSDAQLCGEAVADGEDIATVAARVRLAMDKAASSVLRERLLDARRRLAEPESRPQRRAPYPSFDTIKLRIESAFRSQPELGLAFREGRTQSERDWQSLYDDLIELGAIEPDRDDT